MPYEANEANVQALSVAAYAPGSLYIQALIRRKRAEFTRIDQEVRSRWARTALEGGGAEGQPTPGPGPQRAKALP
jgi:hypothetical protein